MFQASAAFSGFSVQDLKAAKDFYTTVLGLSVEETMGGLRIHLPHGGIVWCYVKQNHVPAAYTMLNLLVENIDEAVSSLTKKGVTFERYEGFEQDEKGIARGKSQNMGPDIAWFKDPSGNILAILEE